MINIPIVLCDQLNCHSNFKGKCIAKEIKIKKETVSRQVHSNDLFASDIEFTTYHDCKKFRTSYDLARKDSLPDDPCRDCIYRILYDEKRCDQCLEETYKLREPNLHKMI